MKVLKTVSTFTLHASLPRFLLICNQICAYFFDSVIFHIYYEKEQKISFRLIFTCFCCFRQLFMLFYCIYVNR